jgi:hypothetical protein
VEAELIGAIFCVPIGSIQFKGRKAMHPIKHLFEDIYRNYWGIAPAAERPKVRRLTKPAARNRDLWVRTERPRD